MNWELWSVSCELKSQKCLFWWKVLSLVNKLRPSIHHSSLSAIPTGEALLQGLGCWAMPNAAINWQTWQTKALLSIISTERWILQFFFQFYTIEQISIECCKTKTQVITLARFTKGTNNPVNQSELKEITCTWCKAWENVCEHVNHNWFSTFGLHVVISYIWMKNWCKMLKQMIYCVV